MACKKPDGGAISKRQKVISKHIKNVFEKGELPPESNVQNLHVTYSDKPVDFYSLDVIISVGYRVKSQRGAGLLGQHKVAGTKKESDPNKLYNKFG